MLRCYTSSSQLTLMQRWREEVRADQGRARGPWWILAISCVVQWRRPELSMELWFHQAFTGISLQTHHKPDAISTSSRNTVVTSKDTNDVNQAHNSIWTSLFGRYRRWFVARIRLSVRFWSADAGHSFSRRWLHRQHRSSGATCWTNGSSSPSLLRVVNPLSWWRGVPLQRRSLAIWCQTCCEEFKFGLRCNRSSIRWNCRQV